MTDAPLTVLVVGASGSIGRPVVDAALRRGHRVRAFGPPPDGDFIGQRMSRSSAAI